MAPLVAQSGRAVKVVGSNPTQGNCVLYANSSNMYLACLQVMMQAGAKKVYYEFT